MFTIENNCMLYVTFKVLNMQRKKEKERKQVSNEMHNCQLTRVTPAYKTRLPFASNTSKASMSYQSKIHFYDEYIQRVL